MRASTYRVNVSGVASDHDSRLDPNVTYRFIKYSLRVKFRVKKSGSCDSIHLTAGGNMAPARFSKFVISLTQKVEGSVVGCQ